MKQYLCFKIRGHWLGIDIGNVVEILKPESQRLSSLTSETGTFEFEGRTLTAIHMGDVLLGEQIKYDTSNRVLISKLGDIRAGLIVDSAEEIVRVDEDVIGSIESTIAPLRKEYLDGCLNLEDRKVYLISTDKLHQLVGVS